ncbi:MAG: hypothetical protein AB7F35_07000 [Acetobacteraceae bacterium]|uniref:hypothetical protein n=1 Tax=Bradyrhizobium sp. TaxID=376 RepID=UPI003D13C909
MDDAGKLIPYRDFAARDPRHDPVHIKDADHGRSAREDARKHELCVMMNPGNFPGL